MVEKIAEGCKKSIQMFSVIVVDKNYGKRIFNSTHSKSLSPNFALSEKGALEIQNAGNG